MSILPSLAAKMRELEDRENVVRSQVGIVIQGTSSEAEKERARAWMKGHFPETVVHMEEEMAGMEMPVVISVGNINIQKLINIVSLFTSQINVKIWPSLENKVKSFF